MARTDANTVKDILLDNYGRRADGTDPSLTVFINAATKLVDQVALCATSSGTPLTDEELANIEGWLAAHFYVASDRQLKSKATERASASFDWKTEMGLDGSTFGQMAKLLDWTGCLASLNSVVVSGQWLGQTEPEQTDYQDRME